MLETHSKSPVTKTLAKINCLINSAIYCTQAIEETSGKCPECGQSGKMIHYKKVSRKGKVGSLMKFCCSRNHNWRVTLFSLAPNAFEGTFRYKGQTYELIAANPSPLEATQQ